VPEVEVAEAAGIHGAEANKAQQPPPPASISNPIALQRIALELRHAGIVPARDGYLDDPTYIQGLSKSHPLKARENVFAFSMACASLQTLQMLAMVLDPLGRSNPGQQLYHFVGGFMEPSQHGKCNPECLFADIVALGDHNGFEVTGLAPSTGDSTVEMVPEVKLTAFKQLTRSLKRSMISMIRRAQRTRL